ncbi:hypothetical protein ADH66_16865 [Acutalibacter muris]|uniref:Uncharacterized protein n=1 Tax=Acutalibacter muris TaxID=1796620 RepID=A0ABN5A5P7_9FIRM|nr:hypothetical protein ADH66_16865 [Acutalibacter muris]
MEVGFTLTGWQRMFSAIKGSLFVQSWIFDRALQVMKLLPSEKKRKISRRFSYTSTARMSPHLGS